MLFHAPRSPAAAARTSATTSASFAEAWTPGSGSARFTICLPVVGSTGNRQGLAATSAPRVTPGALGALGGFQQRYSGKRHMVITDGAVPFLTPERGNSTCAVP